MSDKKTNVITNMEINGDNFYFWSGTAKYQIPSKIYPLSSKKNKECFYDGNTVDFNNDVLIDVINGVNLLMGHCYSNASMLHNCAKDKGIELEYYSGWVILANDFPLHHAWLVYRNGEVCSIIDTTTLKLLHRVNQELENRLLKGEISEDNWREVSVKIMKEFEKQYPLNSQNIICGKAAKGSLYIGSPDELDNSRRIYRELVANYPNHPSYSKDGQNINGASKFQEEYYKK